MDFHKSSDKAEKAREALLAQEVDAEPSEDPWVSDW
jgi:hypothetical protein